MKVKEEAARPMPYIEHDPARIDEMFRAIVGDENADRLEAEFPAMLDKILADLGKSCEEVEP